MHTSGNTVSRRQQLCCLRADSHQSTLSHEVTNAHMLAAGKNETQRESRNFSGRSDGAHIAVSSARTTLGGSMRHRRYGRGFRAQFTQHADNKTVSAQLPCAGFDAQTFQTR
eukprot:2460155-Pleurochrysis_carterae.AAC.1